MLNGETILIHTSRYCPNFVCCKKNKTFYNGMKTKAYYRPVIKRSNLYWSTFKISVAQLRTSNLKEIMLIHIFSNSTIYKNHNRHHLSPYRNSTILQNKRIFYWWSHKIKQMKLNSLILNDIIDYTILNNITLYNGTTG